MPYWRLSGFYLLYFGALGALIPYWGLYLQDQGLTPLAIGELMAILTGTKLVAPNLWGWLADRTGAAMPLVRLACLLAALTFTAIFLARGFWAIAAVMFVASFFWNAALPQMEAITFNHLGPRANRYASVRLWGSIGFILTVAGLGWLLQGQGTGVVPWVVLALFFGIWGASLLVPAAAQGHQGPGEDSLSRLLRRPEILAFLASCLLMQVSHGAYYAFYSIYLKSAGYGSPAVGGLWAWAVFVEVLVFLRMHRLLERFGARRVLLASLALAVLRWLLIGNLVDLVAVQVLAQALHAATFGAFHAAAIHLAHHYFPRRAQGRGQALYNSLSFGAGGAAGSLLAGRLWTDFDPAVTFGAAALAAGLGWLVAWVWVDRGRRF
jgi:MFS transporter, PPP family, 3-phenylpropionic acid transporter